MTARFVPIDDWLAGHGATARDAPLQPWEVGHRIQEIQESSLPGSSREAGHLSEAQAEPVRPGDDGRTSGQGPSVEAPPDGTTAGDVGGAAGSQAVASHGASPAASTPRPPQPVRYRRMGGGHRQPKRAQRPARRQEAPTVRAGQITCSRCFAWPARKGSPLCKFCAKELGL